MHTHGWFLQAWLQYTYACKSVSLTLKLSTTSLSDMLHCSANWMWHGSCWLAGHSYRVIWPTKWVKLYIMKMNNCMNLHKSLMKITHAWLSSPNFQHHSKNNLFNTPLGINIFLICFIATKKGFFVKVMIKIFHQPILWI